MSYHADTEAMLDALARTPNWSRVKEAGLDDETAAAILTEAAKLAEEQVAPINAVGDRTGARFDAGKVTLPADFHAAFAALAEGGWLGLETPEDLGGMGLPTTLFAATDPFFERACPAIMMAASSGAGASALLAEWGDPATRDDWVPALASGERAATICISESEAGSDLGRIRTRAEQAADGSWRVTGQKIWISFGDHDMTTRIGHCLLARCTEAPGTRGLGLFLVENGPEVVTERIEEKLGLHGSPTCVLRFDNAPAILIGEAGRGLPQLFTMIKHMRLQVGCQGLGVALNSYAVALDHAETRRQGGNPKEPPVAIIHHADVRRQLLEIKSRIDLFRLALLEAATASDLSEADPDLARLCAWMLPLIKTFGAELGFDAASRAIQVLGGGGYTQDYPVEQGLRDSRVFQIYEGTTGMQGQDFLMRQSVAAGGAALQVFLRMARAECADLPGPLAVIDRFATFAETEAATATPEVQMAMADAFLRAGWIAVQAWMSARIAGTIEADWFLASAPARLDMHLAEARAAAHLA